MRALLLLPLLLPGWASALAPLVPAADVAEPGLVAWWKPGDLLVGHPDQEGRPGMRPLVSLVPLVLPTDLNGYTRLGGACVAQPESARVIGGRRLRATVTASAEGPVVQVLSGDRLLAVNALGRPALVCEVLLGDADSLPGPEVVVAWRMELSEGELWGVTVYRLPEAAR